MSASTLLEPDLARKRALQRMRAVALSLLLLAAVIYLATFDTDGVLGFVNAGAEAAMVGALADWFAVTALFRHPLGLPIPHTALIPERKSELGASLRDFVSDNFLAESVVREKLAGAELTLRIAEWTKEPEHTARIIHEASRIVRHGLHRVKDEDVATLIDQVLMPRVLEDQLSPIAGHALVSVVEDGAHHGLVDLALTELADWLRDNPGAVAQVVGSRAPWWSPTWLDDKVIERVNVEVVAWVQEVRDAAQHPARRSLDGLLLQLGRDLQTDPSTMERAEALKVRVLSHPAVVRTSLSVWDALRNALVEATEDADGPLRKRASRALCDLVDRVTTDIELRARLDGHLADAAGYVVNEYGTEMASLISDTVERWDGREAAERIELFVGRDLQFIRINGTVVGGLAGIAIHAISLLL